MCYSLAIHLAEGLTTKHQLETNCIIGRHSSCKIYLPIRFISRHHCTLILMPPDAEHELPYYLIRDGHILGEQSANGTWVNGQSVLKLVELKHGDVITFASGAVYPQVIFLDDCAKTEDSSKSTVPGHERPALIQ
jgi:pSer/pThr/pTyr-binding forkhead associated (FHA) protein